MGLISCTWCSSSLGEPIDRDTDLVPITSIAVLRSMSAAGGVIKIGSGSAGCLRYMLPANQTVQPPRLVQSRSLSIKAVWRSERLAQVSIGSSTCDSKTPSGCLAQRCQINGLPRGRAKCDWTDLAFGRQVCHCNSIYSLLQRACLGMFRACT